MKNNKIFYLLVIIFFIIFQMNFHINPLASGDAEEYSLIAQNLANGYGYAKSIHSPTILRPPAYIFLVAMLIKIFGKYAYGILPYLQLLFVLGALFFANKILLLLKPKAGASRVVFNLLYTAYFPNYLYAAQLMPETSMLFLFFMAIYFFLRNKFLWCGVIFALLVLNKGTFLYLPLILFVYEFLRIKKVKTIKNFVIVYAVICLICSPWMIRNFIVFHSPIISSIGIGNVIWPGNNIKNDGLWDWNNDLARNEIVDKYDEITADKLLTKKALASMRNYPLATFNLWLKKAYRFWLQPIGYKTLFEQGGVFLANCWMVFHWLILFFATIGFFLNFKNINTKIILLIIFYYYGLHIILYAIPRYHYPLWPLIMILAAIQLETFYKKFKT